MDGTRTATFAVVVGVVVAAIAADAAGVPGTAFAAGNGTKFVEVILATPAQFTPPPVHTATRYYD